MKCSTVVRVCVSCVSLVIVFFPFRRGLSILEDFYPRERLARRMARSLEYEYREGPPEVMCGTPHSGAIAGETIDSAK